MKQEHILSILYDLALITSGESDPTVLTGKFLQRLMFHTNMPLGLYLDGVNTSNPVDGEFSARLVVAIGDPDLSKKTGSEYLLPAELATGAQITNDPGMLASRFEQSGAWKSGLSLPISNHALFILLSPDEIRQDIPWANIFRPVLDNFSHVLSLCQANAAQTALLAAANHELEAFSYSISHDLRAPLRAIDGFTRALSEDYGETLDKTALHYLERVITGAQRMSMLIDDLLELSRIGRTSLTYEKVDLSSLAAEISNTLRLESPDQKTEIRVQPNLTAKGDARLLHVALTNLLGNAWKYSSKTENALVEFGAVNKGGETVYFVRDNGTGFDMQFAGKLFGPFQRLHGAEFPGTGIGLATVKRIINRHHGQIWAESEVGKGATFYFTLGTTNLKEGN